MIVVLLVLLLLELEEEAAVVVVVLEHAPDEQPLVHSDAAHVPELHDHLWVVFLHEAPPEPVVRHARLS